MNKKKGGRTPRGRQMDVFTVATYNVMLMLDKPWRFQGAAERSARLAKSVYSGFPVIPDVVCLQELETNYWDVACSFHQHRHSAGPVAASWCSSKIRFWPSGLCTLSKYPITHEYHHIFTGRTYHVEIFVAKAALYTRVLHPVVGAVNVVNVHLNAWTTPQAQAARFEQVQQLSDWLNQLPVPEGEPLVVAGDFNVDFYENFEQIEKMAAVLRCRCVLPDKTQFSFDVANNELVGVDDPSEYQTVPGSCQNVPPRQLVDGFLLRQQVQTEASVEVVYLRSQDVFALHFNLTTRRLARDLSDHFPVLLRWHLGRRTPEEEVARRVVVRDGVFSLKLFLYQAVAVGALLSLWAYARQRKRSR